MRAMSPQQPPTCPNCGADLELIAGGGQTPPWGCQGCVRAWWCAELTVTARRAWSPERRSFTGQRAAAVAQEAEAEAAESRDRGISVPVEMLDLLSDDQLDALVQRVGGITTTATRRAIHVEAARRAEGAA